MSTKKPASAKPVSKPTQYDKLSIQLKKSSCELVLEHSKMWRATIRDFKNYSELSGTHLTDAEIGKLLYEAAILNRSIVTIVDDERCEIKADKANRVWRMTASGFNNACVAEIAEFEIDNPPRNPATLGKALAAVFNDTNAGCRLKSLLACCSAAYNNGGRMYVQLESDEGGQYWDVNFAVDQSWHKRIPFEAIDAVASIFYKKDEVREMVATLGNHAYTATSVAISDGCWVFTQWPEHPTLAYPQYAVPPGAKLARALADRLASIVQSDHRPMSFEEYQESQSRIADPVDIDVSALTLSAGGIDLVMTAADAGREFWLLRIGGCEAMVRAQDLLANLKRMVDIVSGVK